MKMWKSFISTLLVVVMLISAFPVIGASAANGTATTNTSTPVGFL